MNRRYYSEGFLRSQMESTKPAREFMYSRIGMNPSDFVLDLGCASGFIIKEISKYTHKIVGIDIDFSILNENYEDRHSLVCANAMQIPFDDSTFDIIMDHYTLMWVKNYRQAIKEIDRVLRRGGYLISIEPDYSGRIEGRIDFESDEPKSSLEIVRALRDAGAFPFFAHKLLIELRNLGYYLEFGVLSWSYNKEKMAFDIQSENELIGISDIESDLFFTYTPTFWIIAKKI